jgi:class 3 adenylate cyclase
VLCARCKRDNPADAQFCQGCGAQLELICSACAASNGLDANFCKKCGTRLAASTELPSETVHCAKPLETSPAVEAAIRLIAPQSDIIDGERKTVSALFADIKGSMELMEDLDPEEARAIVDPALKLMIDAIDRYGGYVVQSTGDGIFALFGAPIAYEDHPQRALYAALRLQDGIRGYSGKLVADGGTPLEARVGINTGEVVVRTLTSAAGRAEYTPIGHTANLAARMQVIAPSGSIAITEHTRRLVEGYFQLKPRGPTRVKGLSEPVEVYEVTGLGPLRTRLQRAAVRGLTKFVGREREIEALKHAAALARAGHGQVVAATADPGVGKSRLFHEFKLISESEWMTLEAFSVSHGKATAYLPVIDLLREYFAIEPEDDTRRRREKVAGKVLMLDRSLEDTLLYLLSLLGLSEANDSLAQMGPQIRRRRTGEAIKRILLRESLNEPLMVIFEDLHWIDSETQALLNLLVDAIANARILLLVNYRPEYRHEWGSRTHYMQLRLDPLRGESAEEMLDALLTSSAALSADANRESSGVAIHDGTRLRMEDQLTALKHLIIERTEGTPFFIEEIVQALFEEGALHGNGVVKLVRPLNAIHVPATVQAVLASRIDRLPAGEKELLQTLAVLGQEFRLNLVARVTLKSVDELEGMLSDLQFGEFIYEQPSAGMVEYSFKHALTQEVAYNSILTERRRTLHERAARAIEGLYTDKLEDCYGDLAHHFLRGNDAAKAIHYAQLAAEQALGRGAYPEATSLVDTALKLLDKLPERTDRLRAELALRSHQSVLARVLFGGASTEREQVIRRVCELGETIGETDQLLRGMLTLSNLYFLRGESIRGFDLVRRCLQLAEVARDPDLLADAHYVAGTLSRSRGNLEQAVSHFDAASVYSSRSDRPMSLTGFLYTVAIASNRAVALHLLGRIDEAVKSEEEALREARESKQLFSLGLATIMGGLMYWHRRDPETVLLHANEAIALSEDAGFIEWLHFGQFAHGWSISQLGQPHQGIAEMEAANAEVDPIGLRTIAIATMLAQGYAKGGRIGEGLVLLNEALGKIEETGTKVDEPEILRLKRELLLLRDNGATEQAEACFRTALQLACEQEAKWWELRTTVSLARLLRDSNRCDEARTMLGKIYNWFTEGFELADLREAKALLDELRAGRCSASNANTLIPRTRSSA